VNRFLHHRTLRAFSLIELLVVVGIVLILVTLFLSARPMRAAQRLELIAGARKIAEWNDSGSRRGTLWEFKTPHCERLVNYCKGDPSYKDWAEFNRGGAREDKDVIRLDELLDLRAEAYAHDPPNPFRFDGEIDMYRVTLELRYLNLRMPPPQ